MEVRCLGINVGHVGCLCVGRKSDIKYCWGRKSVIRPKKRPELLVLE